jgi:hypothetical protein
MTEPSPPGSTGQCYGLFDENRHVGTFYAADDAAALEAARLMHWQPHEVKALRDGKWQEIKL